MIFVLTSIDSSLYIVQSGCREYNLHGSGHGHVLFRRITAHLEVGVV